MPAPAKTPNDVIARLNSALRKILSRPDVASKLEPLSVTPVASSPEEFQALIGTEVKQ